jgi:two-component system, OmpR family, sensor kinase
MTRHRPHAESCAAGRASRRAPACSCSPSHTPEATPIRIGVGTISETSVLEVADQGPGLTHEEGRRIFERFYRADHSRSRTTGGAGLGQAIVHSLVSAHGGRVDPRSTPGHGATFRALLPHPTVQGPRIPPR